MAANQFTGLPMPVFTAFGWAGEETAINFALEQLHAFITNLHVTLPRMVQAELPVYGLSRENQSVYLAADSEIEGDIHLWFLARPMSLEMQLALTNRKALLKAFKLAEAQPATTHRHITELGAEWSLRLQQMQVDEESGEASHYQDLFKDVVTSLDDEAAAAIFSKAAYLNTEDKWITPFYLSRRFPSEQVSAMGTAVVQVMSDQVMQLLPLMQFFSGNKSSKSRKPKSKARIASAAKGTVAGPSAVPVVAQTVPELRVDSEEGFVHVADIKPLHLRRGFINLTPQHWPFFALNSRTETRPITVYYDGVYDKDSSVWRLKPNDLARVVLSPTVHQWFEDNFESNDRVQVVARRLENEEIQISLKPIA